MIMPQESAQGALVLQMSKLLSLDQASRVSGYAIFEDGNLIQVGHFSCEDVDDGDRFHHIKNEIQSLIEQNSITEIVFEDIYMDGGKVNNVATFKKLAAVYGVVYELGTSLGLPITPVLATVWKPGIGIKGRTRADQKRSAQAYVLEHYQKKVTQDEADAVCIGIYYLKHEKSAF